MRAWAGRLDEMGKFGETEKLLLQIGFGEYLSQIHGGIPMNQGEIVRPHDLGLSHDDRRAVLTPEVELLMAAGNTPAARTRLVELMLEQSANVTVGHSGLEDELEMIRDQFRRFAVEVIPFAHEWHLKDELIPMSIIEELAEMGVFGLTIPEDFGGLGLSKASMVVVSEELSRGYIGVGSLDTRTEIAAELILCGGTDDQRGALAPPPRLGRDPAHRSLHRSNTGSDLGSLRTRAVLEGDTWKVTGNKTWITHAARTRADDASGPHRPQHHRLARVVDVPGREDPRHRRDPFPTPGMTGGEIEVLGYRGMKEYRLGFDGFEVKAENLLGGEPGKGFKQLMETFERAHPDRRPRHRRRRRGA